MREKSQRVRNQRVMGGLTADQYAQQLRWIVGAHSAECGLLTCVSLRRRKYADYSEATARALLQLDLSGQDHLPDDMPELVIVQLISACVAWQTIIPCFCPDCGCGSSRCHERQVETSHDVTAG